MSLYNHLISLGRNTKGVRGKLRSSSQRRRLSRIQRNVNKGFTRKKWR